MKDDVISRQSAIDVVRHSPIIEVQPAYMLIDKGDVIKNLIMLTSAQPIIRCKDCLMHGVCRFEQALGLDGYCSQAERRIDAETKV